MVKQVSPKQDRVLRKELLVAAGLVAVGLLISAISLTELWGERPQLAQATQPPQPDPLAEKDGVEPVLPQAPAEKMAPPIKER